MNNKRVFIGVTILWIIIIGGLIGFKEFTIRTGEDILLKTMPIDPRDLFRGDYVILTYDISEIRIEEGQKFLFKRNDRVYVLLDVDLNRVGKFSQVQKNKPTDEDVTYIEGRVLDLFSGLNNESYIRVGYGIESYFVPEGRGLEIERNLGEIYVKIKLDKNGKAILRSLVLEDEEIKF